VEESPEERVFGHLLHHHRRRRRPFQKALVIRSFMNNLEHNNCLSSSIHFPRFHQFTGESICIYIYIYGVKELSLPLSRCFVC